MNHLHNPLISGNSSGERNAFCRRNVHSCSSSMAFLMVTNHVADAGARIGDGTCAASSARASVGAPRINESKIGGRDAEAAFRFVSASTFLPDRSPATRSLYLPRITRRALNLAPFGSGEQRPEEDPIQAERKRLAYVHGSSSNVALSYRKTPANSTAPVYDLPIAAPSRTALASTVYRSPKLSKDVQSNSIFPSFPPPATIPRKKHMTERGSQKPCRVSAMLCQCRRRDKGGVKGESKIK